MNDRMILVVDDEAEIIRNGEVHFWKGQDLHRY